VRLGADAVVAQAAPQRQHLGQQLDRGRDRLGVQGQGTLDDHFATFGVEDPGVLEEQQETAALHIQADQLVEIVGQRRTTLGETAQALTVTKRYLYVIDNAATNRVVAYLRSATTGKLTLIGAYGTTGTGSRSFILSQGGLGIDATQRFLYACNPGSNDISVMEIDPKTGALSYPSKVPSGGTMPRRPSLKLIWPVRKSRV